MHISYQVPSGKWWRYTPEERIRKNSRTCQNGLQESVYKTGCAIDGDEEVEIFETERCDCTIVTIVIIIIRCDCTPAKEACVGVGIAAEGVGYSDAHFHLTGLKPGDKVAILFQTIVILVMKTFTSGGLCVPHPGRLGR